MTRPETIAVTGGTGFLGRHVLDGLFTQKMQVRALVRDLAQAKPLADAGTQLIPGDLNNTAALAELVKGCDCVIHIAGAIKARTDAQLMTINGGGTQNLVEACKQVSPAIRLIHVSSVTAREPQLSPYACAKAASELAATDHGGPLVILRPNAVYGPGDTETLRVFQMAGGPLHPILGGPEARIAMIHGADAAAAIVAMTAKIAPTGVYEISDQRADGYSWREITKAAVMAVGGKYRPVRVPAFALKTAGATSQFLGKFQAEPPIFTSGKVREILHGSWAVTPSLRIPDRNWQPKIDLAHGFGQTVEWYRQTGWL